MAFFGDIYWLVFYYGRSLVFLDNCFGLGNNGQGGHSTVIDLRKIVLTFKRHILLLELGRKIGPTEEISANVSCATRPLS